MTVDEARRRLLAKIFAVVCGGPAALTTPALASGCGGHVDEPDQTSRSDSPTGSWPSATPTALPIPPRVCPEPLSDYHYSGRCAVEARGGNVCLPRPKDGSCASVYDEECILAGYECGYVQRGDSIQCELPVTDACCWRVNGGCAVGRPFVVDGVAVVAPLIEGDTWTLSSVSASIERSARVLDRATRTAIADVWSLDGLAEHASVASFARFVLELLALGAPADLVAAAQKAIGEEIAHARRSFAIASIYVGASRGPGTLDMNGAFAKPIELADFAARAASEGCIAETVAALQLHAAAEAASEPALRSILRETAEEESEHALLAWRAVSWAIEKGGEPVRRAVSAVFASATTHVGFGPCANEAIDCAVLREHGVLPRRERHDLALATLGSLIAPASEQLLTRGSRPSAVTTTLSG